MEFTVVHEVDGKWQVDDIRYKKYATGWVVYVGKKYLGLAQRPHSPWSGWWAVPHTPNQGVQGFISRRKAVEHMLRVEGYWKDDS